MEGEATSVSEAAAAAAEAVEAAASIVEEQAIDGIAVAVEIANERADRAEATAEQIAEAALESARGQRIEALENRMNELWHDAQRLQSEVTMLTERLSAAEQVTGATAILALLSQSTPPTLTEAPAETIAEAAETVVEILPENVQSAVTPAAPEPELPPAKRKRFL